MSTPTYTLLDSTTLTSSSGTVSFTSISQSYTDLVVVASARTDSTTTTNSGASNFDTCYLRLNNNLSNLHTTHYMEGVGSGSPAGSTTVAETVFRAIGATNANATADTFASSYFVISNYSSTAYSKGAMWQMTGENNGTVSDIRHSAGTFNSTTAVSSIDIFPISGSFVAGSTFYLYAIRSENTENVVPTLKGSGGSVTWDSSYVYHTFMSSGTFTAFGTQSCDIVRVAGGGGGGGSYYSQAGGGGAGGLLYSASVSVSGANTVTIGAGGAGGVSSGSGAFPGSQGSGTSFPGLSTPTGGGGGGSNQGAGPGNGGSGGGGGNDFLGPGTGIAGQGFNGAVLAGSYLGGGGGGAGAAAPTNQYGVGGIGAIYFNKYLAGGGSGSTGMNNTSIYGGGGSVSGPPTQKGISGVYGTGSGGGTGVDGPGVAMPGGNGGSGVVIVRYAR